MKCLLPCLAHNESKPPDLSGTEKKSVTRRAVNPKGARNSASLLESSALCLLKCKLKSLPNKLLKAMVSKKIGSIQILKIYN